MGGAREAEARGAGVGSSVPGARAPGRAPRCPGASSPRRFAHVDALAARVGLVAALWRAVNDAYNRLAAWCVCKRAVVKCPLPSAPRPPRLRAHASGRAHISAVVTRCVLLSVTTTTG